LLNAEYTVGPDLWMSGHPARFVKASSRKATARSNDAKVRPADTKISRDVLVVSKHGGMMIWV
jgi:hypothetical protein